MSDFREWLEVTGAVLWSFFLIVAMFAAIGLGFGTFFGVIIWSFRTITGI